MEAEKNPFLVMIRNHTLKHIISQRNPHNLVANPWKFNRNPLVLKGTPLNLARNSIELGEAIYKTYNEFIPYLIEINK